MKLLLLTDIPPASNYTAGIVLAQLASRLVPGSLVCFCVKDKDLHPVIPDDLSWLKIEYVTKPRENWAFLPRQLGEISSVVGQAWTEIQTNSALRSKIVRFAQYHAVDAVWCVLQGQTMIRLAFSVAQELGLPLLTQVWDPPTWWLRARRVDQFSSNRTLSQFAAALKSSKCCATASWAMATDYHNRYGCQTIPFLPSLESTWAIPPATRLCDASEFTIGLAGQIYATDEWNALLKALEMIDWTLAGKPVRIRLLGRFVNLTANSATNIEFLGWRSQSESLNILSQTDLLYCPYWFTEEFHEESRLSFPSKLTTYLAAGRPVFMHGPAYASPTVCLTENKAAVCCTSIDPQKIASSLQEIAQNKDLYTATAHNGHKAFLQYLTLDKLHSNFQNFITAAFQ
jgi:glycosyltransferase involved in cell wall biosynthesis